MWLERQISYTWAESEGDRKNITNQPEIIPLFVDHRVTRSLDRSSYRRFALVALSILPIWSNLIHQKTKVGSLASHLERPQNTPIVHTCFLAQSVLCVPYKLCHALLFTICAPSPSVRKGGDNKGETGDNRHLSASLLAMSQVREEHWSVLK